ncbi:hypothetical protein Chor_013019 [Crotalus horridus]
MLQPSYRKNRKRNLVGNFCKQKVFKAGVTQSPPFFSCRRHPSLSGTKIWLCREAFYEAQKEPLKLCRIMQDLNGCLSSPHCEEELVFQYPPGWPPVQELPPSLRAPLPGGWTIPPGLHWG